MWSLGLASPSCGSSQGSCSPTPRISTKVLSSLLSSLVLLLLCEIRANPRPLQPPDPRDALFQCCFHACLGSCSLPHCHLGQVRDPVLPATAQLMPSSCTCLSWSVHDVEAWLPGASLQEPWAGTELVGLRGLREGSVGWRGVWAAAGDDGGVSWGRKQVLPWGHFSSPGRRAAAPPPRAV